MYAAITDFVIKVVVSAEIGPRIKVAVFMYIYMHNITVFRNEFTNYIIRCVDEL